MSRSNAIKRCDDIFSLYIRHRDCPNGYGSCISCESTITPKTCDNGHYEDRDNVGTRWDEKNCNAQCRICNQYQDGNKEGYTRGLINKYGEDVIEELHIKANSICKLSENDIRELTKYYTQKLNELP